MKLIGPLVLLGFLSLVEGKVVDNFKTCEAIFVRQDNKRYYPTVLNDHADKDRYKKICQVYESDYRFATLYDTKNRIPVYSAYLYKGDVKTVRSDEWMIEPQLDVPKLEAMITVGVHQALDSDYRDADPYTRGHLYPNSHAYNQDQACSTFTLTNIAPQDKDGNGRWTKVEKDIITAIKDKCNLHNDPQANIITGVIPGPNTPKLNKRVNIPSHYWSAYCCKDKKDQNKFISGGYMLEMTDKAKVTPYTVNVLNTDLKNKYGDNFVVFGELPGCS